MGDDAQGKVAFRCGGDNGGGERGMKAPAESYATANDATICADSAVSANGHDLDGALTRAIQVLREGRPVVFPTDTVYGLGVAVRYANSPKPIFDVKHRAANKPVAWLVASPDDLDIYGVDIPESARVLARAHWPGALTIIVRASKRVPQAFQSDAGTIGLRMPASDIALSLINAAGPIATSSANISGQAATCNGDKLEAALLEAVGASIVVDENPSGVASTVVDCTKGNTIVVRQGGIMVDSAFIVPIDFASHDGKTRINAQVWTSPRFGDGKTAGADRPLAIVQIVHGMAEHIDRYDDFARYLVGQGFVVCAEDHIGHGKSQPDEALLGHMPAHGGKDILLGDVHTLRRIVCELFPNTPYVLYGHSMGSFIARSYIARYGEGVSACVLSGTGNVPAPLSQFGRSLARMLASMRGETYRSAFIDDMGAGGYGKKIENARTHLDWLSTDDAVVDAYIEDDRCGFMFTVGGYATLLDLTAEVVTPACAAKVPKDLPVFLVAGAGDPVGDMGAGVKAAAQLLRAAGVADVDCKIYEGMRHEIHNEIGHEQVYDDITSWIKSHIGAKQ